MATKIKKKGPDILDVPAAKGDLEKFVEQVRANPALYGAAAGFIVLCVLAGLIYRFGTQSSSRSGMTMFARAIDNEDPALRAAELDPMAKGKGALSAQALYLEGESAFEAKEYDKAQEAFERLRSEFPSAPCVPDAVEGLGYIAENAGQYDQAVTSYNEVAEKWPGAFAKRRQPLNIARCKEQLNDVPGAIAAYQAQVEEFPGSSFEEEAKDALERLRREHPDLFPKEAPPAEEKPAEAATGTPPAATPAEPSKPSADESATPAAPAPGNPAETPNPPAEDTQPPASQ